MPEAAMIPYDIIKRIPKVELHDHLDGGLRPSTVIDLARKYDISIPSQDPAELADWFEQGCKLKSLTLYLQTFAVTTAVMQTEEALRRVAYEAVLDWNEEHIVYGEVRFAPVLHTNRGLSMDDVVQAVLKGLEQGRKETGVQFGLILCAMRNQSPNLSLEIAKLAVAYRDRGVVGFDLAGDEKGNPPKDHIDAFQYIRNKNFNITIHAGEAFGLDSIWQAIQVCGAQRIGHGTRLVDDMSLDGMRIEKMGDLAHFVQDKRIPLEMCISSNIGTGAAKSFGTHPFIVFFRNHFRVSLCTDNRLMSNTNLTKEMNIAAENFGLTLKDLERISVNAMKSAFIHHDEKLNLIYDVIKKQCADIRKEYGYSDWN
ncbi:MAG: adenosine deaminase [Sphaerochaetaceae bacterium]|jgi:adenosine deaminase|nr:adenosine deaminase [Sphaerochaetaceae bacterium]